MGKKIIVKLNGGNPVVLCDKCRKIIAYISDYPKDIQELLLNAKWPAQYCPEHHPNNIKHNDSKTKSMAIPNEK